MNEFKKLIEVADRLLSPEGCAWDREQTLFTLQPYLLEEAHELLEAIDGKNFNHVCEELGDVLYTLIFIAKLCEKEGRFSLSDAIDLESQKLIRRHPHVFGEGSARSSDEIVAKWEEIKKQEGKKSPLSGIPATLPALARAQKVIQKLRRMKQLEKTVADFESEEELGRMLWEIVRQAEAKGIDAESALRRVCQSFEAPHR